ncbi:MAG: Smr/MutS family protein, partial [Myxococcota bacterium]|nr:Smr/MutS family protein [Myxococcota bacterium]
SQHGILKASIQKKLQESLESYAPMLQEKYYTERNGRYVLPMKATYKRSVGLVHGRSQSGETFYVEPLVLVPMANKLKELEVAWAQERRRIFRELTLLVRTHIDFFRSSMNVVADLDVCHARMTVGEKLNGVTPLIGEQGCIYAQDVMHPVLMLGGVDVVPNHFSIDGQSAALIISGPNAGGKTIALKTLGLLVWMMRAGIPVPAREGVRIDFFSLVAADIGDAQQVTTGLSTFSGHLVRLKEIVEIANPNSLVLLDEIGMGTDPAQGSALAQVVMEHLLDRGARLVVTTHFSRLKALSKVDSRYTMMAADFYDGSPTYQLSIGEVGQSHALALAQTLRFPSHLIEQARRLLTQGERDLGDLLLELEELRSTAAQREEDLRLELIRLEHERRELAEYRKEQERRKEEIEEEVRVAFGNTLYQRELHIKQMISELKKKPSLKSASNTVAALRNMRKELQEEGRVEQIETLSEKIEIRVGDRVTHKLMGDGCEVIRLLRGGRYQLRVRGMLLECSREELSRHAPYKAPKQPVLKTETSMAKKGKADPRGDWNTCDLRGKRVEESKRIAEKFFDDQESGTVYLLHGHGTGILKTSLRKWLPSSPYVDRFRAGRPEEGGDAFTVVQIKTD